MKSGGFIIGSVFGIVLFVVTLWVFEGSPAWEKLFFFVFLNISGLLALIGGAR